MRPVVTPEQMRAVDLAVAAAEGGSLSGAIERAGWAVAERARRMLGGTYGRRVLVVAGPGNNGADGRVAARVLGEWGVRCVVLDALGFDSPSLAAVERTGRLDLVIDAAFGIGFRADGRAEWSPPRVSAPVLAVDVPSGVNGLDGSVHGDPWPASVTVTFGALKPGLLFRPGAGLCGDIDVVDAGLAAHLAAQPIDTRVIEDDDVRSGWPRRGADAHKWRSGLFVVAGSNGMAGAARLACDGALHAGAGIVHLVTPGGVSDRQLPTEVVRRSSSTLGWADDVLAMLAERRGFGAVVVGPGLGRDDAVAAGVRRLVSEADLPMVVDGDGSWALSWGSESPSVLIGRRRAATVLTPHDGEFTSLHGSPPGTDRILAARRLASSTGAVVLLKGPTTVVADPSGRCAVVRAGDDRLATAGSGDVLAGIVGAAIAAGAPAFQAAALSAHVHGMAGRRGHRIGLVAGDLPALVAEVLSGLAGAESSP